MILLRDPAYQLVIPPDANKDRSVGIHVTPVLTDFYIRAHAPKWAENKEGEDPDERKIDPMFAIRGWAFENALGKAFAQASGVKLSQTEICVDEGGIKIFMTPDWWALPDEVVPYPHLIESKATDKSMKKLEDPALDTPEKLVASFKQHFRLWDLQIQCYLRNLHMVACHLYVWWVRGDYKFGGPRGVETVKRYVLGYQVHELEETWSTIKNHARRMRAEGRFK